MLSVANGHTFSDRKPAGGRRDGQRATSGPAAGGGTWRQRQRGDNAAGKIFACPGAGDADDP
jgi:hypothetical protein